MTRPKIRLIFWYFVARAVLWLAQRRANQLKRQVAAVAGNLNQEREHGDRLRREIGLLRTSVERTRQEIESRRGHA